MPRPVTASDETIVRFCVENPMVSIRHLRNQFQIGHTRADDLIKRARVLVSGTKKIGVTNWREHVQHAKLTQALRRKGSYSQDFITIDIFREYGLTCPIVLQYIGDLHIGSLATNYEALTEITDGVLKTPNLFWVLNGDLLETTAVFRNALAVHSQLMDIDTQHSVLESWLNEIAPKVLTAGWDNHSVEREEKLGASSHTKYLLSRRFRYHNGLGRIDIQHGKALYQMVVSHKVTGYSIYNHLHGAKRLIRQEFPDADIVAVGDRHTPDVETYYDGNHRRVAIMGGSLKTSDGYTKRYFSLYTHMDMPSVVLYPDQKFFAGYLTAAEGLAVAKAMPEPPEF